uniref:Uncharacterized protein n=1 Tax=Anopheles darlingi TaxID=43151 RepID=A0A2M4D8L5_ANODA
MSNTQHGLTNQHTLITCSSLLFWHSLVLVLWPTLLSNTIGPIAPLHRHYTQRNSTSSSSSCRLSMPMLLFAYTTTTTTVATTTMIFPSTRR